MASKNLLTIRNMTVAIGTKKIINRFSLTIKPGELHVFMGPNGSGKSTLAQALLGAPKYRVKADALMFDGHDLSRLTTDARARLGMFLGFQYPLAIPGISLATMLTALQSTPTQTTKHLTLASQMQQEKRERSAALHEELRTTLESLGLDSTMLYRGFNDGFSGGEKKKTEILQMAALKPKLAILDEPDSGLDIDALKTIARAINAAHRAHMAILLITHYQRILRYLKPDAIHIISQGQIVRSGGPELARMVEQQGYDTLAKRHANKKRR